MRTIFFNSQYLKVNDQIIDAFTPGIFKAEGVFETMLALDGVVIDAAVHLKRLQVGLKFFGIKSPPFDPSVLQEVLNRNHLSSGRVRLMVWQAPPIAGQAGKQIHVMVVAMAYQVPNKKSYRVCLIKTDRIAEHRLANVKSLDYCLFAQAYDRAKAQGFDEALLLNRHGHIFEASRANIFWMKDRILYTPPLSSGCLKGITRQQVIKVAGNLKITVKEKDLTPEDLKKADASFLTNSLIGIKPVEIKMIRYLSIRE